MSIIDIFRVGKIKERLESCEQGRAALSRSLDELGGLNYAQIKAEIARLDELRLRKEAELIQLANDISRKKEEIVVLDDEALLQSFALYKPRYELKNSEAYRDRLDAVRDGQRAMIKADSAATCPTSWTINGNQKEGTRMVRDFQKLLLRAFNNECDATITDVKFNNVTALRTRISKSFDAVNKLGRVMSIHVAEAYRDLKIEELQLCYEYAVKKQEEKEEQKRIREQMREEAKVQREIEERKREAEKEEKHFLKALSSIEQRLASASTDVDRDLLLQQRASIEQNLVTVGRTKEDILYREQNTRAGYVYVISNVGSFGDNIYKIGVTRRFDPEERVDELGDASVPFCFDIHATIFSDDAPALENALHKAFDNSRLNKINRRREFFRVTLDEIERVVRQNFGKPVEFRRLADAPEYRQSAVLGKAA